MEVFKGNGNISITCDSLQKDKLQIAREMQQTLMKVMAKIFSAKVVIERLPDNDRREKQANNEQSSVLEDEKENALNECENMEAHMRRNCMSLEYSACNHVDKNCTDATEIVDKCISVDHPEAESNVLDVKKSNRQSHLQYYIKFCPDCSKTESSGKKNLKCKKCNLRWNYECKICSKQLSTYAGIIRHLVTKCVPKGHYFACFECDYKSTHKYEVSRHLKKVHLIPNALNRIEKVESEIFRNDAPTTPRFNCSKCKRPFEKLPQLLRHFLVCGQKHCSTYSKKLSHTTRNKCFHHCVKCKRTMKNRSTSTFYGKECPTCHTKFSFKCKECNKIFHSYNSIHLHLKIHHKPYDKDEFKCSECNFRTSMIEYLSRHVKRKHSNETHACMNCSRKYITSIAYRDHARYCKQGVGFECDSCKRKFKTKPHLARHIFQVHTDGNEIDCPQCSLTLKNKYSLRIHLTYCQKEAMHQCMKCPFKTKYKIEYSRHQIRIHSEVKK